MQGKVKLFFGRWLDDLHDLSYKYYFIIKKCVQIRFYIDDLYIALDQMKCVLR